MPPSIQCQLDQLTQSLCETLASNLIGVYLHGSLAMGCFNPDTSDIDLLVVCQAPLAAAIKHRLLAALLTLSGLPSPLEISFVHYAQIRPWRHPAPYDLHFSEMHRPAVATLLTDGAATPPAGGVDFDLAAHFTVLAQRGCCLAGAAIADLAVAVPWADYIDSLQRDFLWAESAGNAPDIYAVLNACRILAAVEARLVLSKAEGAAWALARIPRQHHAVVLAAAAGYAGAPQALPDGASAVWLAWVRNRLGW